MYMHTCLIIFARHKKLNVANFRSENYVTIRWNPLRIFAHKYFFFSFSRFWRCAFVSLKFTLHKLLLVTFFFFFCHRRWMRNEFAQKFWRQRNQRGERNENANKNFSWLQSKEHGVWKSSWITIMLLLLLMLGA